MICWTWYNCGISSVVVKSESNKAAFFFFYPVGVLHVLGNEYGAATLVIYPSVAFKHFFLCLSTAVGLGKKVSRLERSTKCT